VEGLYSALSYVFIGIDLLINNLLPLHGLQIAFRKLDYTKGVFNGVLKMAIGSGPKNSP